MAVAVLLLLLIHMEVEADMMDTSYNRQSGNDPRCPPNSSKPTVGSFCQYDGKPCLYGSQRCCGGLSSTSAYNCNPNNNKGWQSIRVDPCTAYCNGEWSNWGSCIAGRRTRQCNNPPPSGGGNGCQGANQEACGGGAGSKVDGGWSNWGSCANGKQSRSCTKPAPSGGGQGCKGAPSQACSSAGKKVDGSWSSWQPCSGGKQTRKCDSPKPAGGGKDCSGSGSKDCSVKADGKYGAWGLCSKGKRTRLCNNPTPSGGGAPCKDGKEQTEDCGKQPKDQCNGGANCCTKAKPCGPREGDCNENEDCSGELVCGSNNCVDHPDFGKDDDCCTEPVENDDPDDDDPDDSGATDLKSAFLCFLMSVIFGLI